MVAKRTSNKLRVIAPELPSEGALIQEIKRLCIQIAQCQPEPGIVKYPAPQPASQTDDEANDGIKPEQESGNDGSVAKLPSPLYHLLAELGRMNRLRSLFGDEYLDGPKAMQHLKDVLANILRGHKSKRRPLGEWAYCHSENAWVWIEGLLYFMTVGKVSRTRAKEVFTGIEVPAVGNTTGNGRRLTFIAMYQRDIDAGKEYERPADLDTMEPQQNVLW